MAGTTSEVISLNPIKRQTILVPIEGITPLMAHRFSEKAKKQMLEDQVKTKAKPKRDPQNPEETLDGFTVYGVGIGPRAVGSVAVDRLEFAPGTVNVREGQTAGYGFHSRSTFDNAAVEFVRVNQTPDGVRTVYVNGKRIPGGVRQDAWVESDASERWNGYDVEDRVSEGHHQLQVRVWDDGGDWLGAWSDSLVTVQ